MFQSDSFLRVCHKDKAFPFQAFSCNFQKPFFRVNSVAHFSFSAVYQKPCAPDAVRDKAVTVLNCFKNVPAAP